MLNLNIKTKLSPEDVIKSAEKFFGSEGYKLEMKRKSGDRIYFEGGGGGVEVIACIEGDKTSVDMETREWEYQVKEFAIKMK